MTFDELLDDIAAEHPEYKETIEMSKIVADETTRFILKNDMVSVIRCKDCKHSESFPYGTREKRYCNLHDTTMRENDFCSRGEIKRQMHRIIEIEVGCCEDCPFYNWEQHKCSKGATEEGAPQDHFYLDCPMKWREKKADSESGKAETT